MGPLRGSASGAAAAAAARGYVRLGFVQKGLAREGASVLVGLEILTRNIGIAKEVERTVASFAFRRDLAAAIASSKGGDRFGVHNDAIHVRDVRKVLRTGASVEMVSPRSRAVRAGAAGGGVAGAGALEQGLPWVLVTAIAVLVVYRYRATGGARSTPGYAAVHQEDPMRKASPAVSPRRLDTRRDSGSSARAGLEPKSPNSPLRESPSRRMFAKRRVSREGDFSPLARKSPVRGVSPTSPGMRPINFDG